MRRAAARSSAEGDTAATMADVLAAVLRGETEIAVEAGPQRVAIQQHRRTAMAEQPALQRARQGRFSGSRQPRQPHHGAAVTVTRRAFVVAKVRFHRHDIDRNGALAGIDREHQTAAGNAAIDLDHQPSGARIVGIGIGRQRLAQRNIDLADVIARDRLGLDAREFTGINGFFDRDHGRTGFPRAKPHQDRSARHQRLVVQPEDTRMKPSRVARRASDMGDHVAPFDE